MKTLLAFSLAIFFVSSFSPGAEAQPLCVNKSKVHLRSGPGNKHSVSWTVGKNMPLMQVGQKGKWLNVEDVDGQTHWVQASAVRVVTGSESCAVVITKTAPLKKGPDEQAPASDFSSVDKYTPFKKIDRDGAWVQVEDDYRATYWVHESRIWIPMNRATVSY